MKYDFTAGADRRGDGSSKYLEEKLANDPLLIPMWVADMDFHVPPEVTEALVKKAQYGVFGYTDPSEEYLESVCDWMKRRHDFTVEKEWILPVPGIVPALRIIVQALTEPGENILIFPPVYFPFEKSIVQSGRTCIKCPLIEENLQYSMDFDLTEKLIAENDVKMIILCSPHNPAGRVWSFDELKKLGEICEKYNVIMISDEIHMDFSRKQKHIPFVNAAPFWKEKTIICTAPSKTFNLAGLQVSNVIIFNKELFDKVEHQMMVNGLSKPNIFGLEACTAAYSHGDGYVDDLNAAIEENSRTVQEYLKENIPEIRMAESQGTYLFWLDCRDLGMNNEELADFMMNKAHVWMNDGGWFGGPGFMRMNAACPNSTVQKALGQIKAAVDQWREEKQNIQA